MTLELYVGDEEGTWLMEVPFEMAEGEAQGGVDLTHTCSRV